MCVVCSMSVVFMEGLGSVNVYGVIYAGRWNTCVQCMCVSICAVCGVCYMYGVCIVSSDVCIVSRLHILTIIWQCHREKGGEQLQLFPEDVLPCVTLVQP